MLDEENCFLKFSILKLCLCKIDIKNVKNVDITGPIYPSKFAIQRTCDIIVLVTITP